MNHKELKTILDEEWIDVEYYDCLKPNTIKNIRCWLYLDIFQSYIKFKHPLIVFVSNSYTDSFTDDYFAISVSESPDILVEPNVWNISHSDIAEIINYISNHCNELRFVATDLSDSDEYEKTYDSLFEQTDNLYNK